MKKGDILRYIEDMKIKFLVIRLYKYKVAVRQLLIKGNLGDYVILKKNELEILAKNN